MASPLHKTPMASPLVKGGWKAAIFIIMVEVAERFAFYGINGGLITYLTTAMGVPTATAAKNVNLWQGVAFVCPLVGAVVADSLLGRFKTAFFSSFVYLCGLVLLFLSSLVIPMKSRLRFVYISLYILAVGQGGHRPSVQTFAADQFDESTPEERATKSSFFNWWFFGIIVGVVMGISSVWLIQNNVSWPAGFGVPAGSMLLALIVLVSGMKFYRREGPPANSPYTRVAQVVVAAARKRGVKEEKWAIYTNEDDMVCKADGGGFGERVNRKMHFSFLDKAMVIDNIDASREVRDPWRLCTLRQVEEVKQVLNLLPIWLACFPFSVVYAQLFTFFTKQANIMKGPTISPHIKIPPYFIPFLISAILVLILLVFYERVFVPFMKKITRNPIGISILQRIGIGEFLSMLVMLISAIVEEKRVRVSKSGGSLSVWWLVPQYTVLAVAEVFVVVGMQHFFYDQMPKGLRSLGAAFYLCVLGIGSFISSGIISIVQAVTSRYHEKWLVDNLDEAHLDGYFWILTVLCGLGFCGFVWVSSRFVYHEVDTSLDDVEN